MTGAPGGAGHGGFAGRAGGGAEGGAWGRGSLGGGAGGKALACVGLCAAGLCAALALSAAPGSGLFAARLFMALSLFLAACAAAFALLFFRSLSRALRRLLEAAAGEAGMPAPALPEPATAGAALRALEAAMLAAAAETRRREEEAGAEGRQYLAILNGMSEAVLAMDRGLSLRLANRRACSLFGLDEWRGSSLLKATRSTALEAAAARAIAEGRPLEAEIRLRRGGRGGGRAEGRAESRRGESRRGSERLFRVFAAPLGAPPGAPPPEVPQAQPRGGAPQGGAQESAAQLGAPPREAEGAVIVLEDITRLSRLEQVRKDFVANVSHELRTPIQLIKGFSETILEDPAFAEAFSEDAGRPPEAPPGPEEGLGDGEPAGGRRAAGGRLRRFVEIIRRNAETMENLTNDLLAIASLESRDGGLDSVLGKRRLQPLAPLFEEAALSVGLRAEKRGASVSVDCPRGLEASVHGSLIVQALINLMDNAVKYSPKGSQARASARALAGGGAVLEVRDEGIGISSEHIGRVFERFYRVDKARSRESGGTGLGLAIVRHIALLHGGSAEVESHAGEGSAFRIVLP